MCESKRIESPGEGEFRSDQRGHTSNCPLTLGGIYVDKYPLSEGTRSKRIWFSEDKKNVHEAEARSTKGV